MNDNVTILGRVGGEPKRNDLANGVTVVNFRVASPQRRYDAKTKTWLETGTNWYNVSAFRQLGEHVRSSLRQGDAVIVSGKLKLREWETAERKGMSADIEAETVGHDLRWGTSAFAKASRPVSAQEATAQTVDAVTGEVHDVDADAAEDEHDPDEAGDNAADEQPESSMAFSGSQWSPRE